MSKERDLSCFSYIAAAKVFQINRYPNINQGAEVNRIIPTLAADAPIVAVAASRLGLHTQLIANTIGTDTEAERIFSYLQQEHIYTNVRKKKVVQTPQIIILSDDDGNREWFSFTRKAQKELATLAIDSLKTSRMVYIDLYSGIAEASARVIDFTNRKGIPSYINISGNVDDVALAEYAKSDNLLVVQGSIPESRSAEAKDFVENLYDMVKTKTAIVSMGEKGAIAYNGNEFITADAYPVNPLHVHGAGAAFSVGYIFGAFQNWSIQDTLQYACAVGSWSCTQKRGFATITREIIEEFQHR